MITLKLIAGTWYLKVNGKSYSHYNLNDLLLHAERKELLVIERINLCLPKVVH